MVTLLLMLGGGLLGAGIARLNGASCRDCQQWFVLGFLLPVCLIGMILFFGIFGLFGLNPYRILFAGKQEAP